MACRAAINTDFCLGLILIIAGFRRLPSAIAGSAQRLLGRGIESNPLQLDPRYSTDANSVRIGNLIYNSLLRYDERSQLQPELAENWRMLDDRTYLFDLRQNVMFHNGKPLTAADVKYTYESILEPSQSFTEAGVY